MLEQVMANFFIVGAAKAGTTSLSKYLNQHPDIFMSPIKEPKYFSVPDNRYPHTGPGAAHADSRVIKNKGDYDLLFNGAENYRVRGEASVDYLYYPGVAKRIKQYNPDAKIVIILRNPVERAYSAYMHYIRDGHESLSFEDALAAEVDRKLENREFFWLYKELGYYYEQVKRYLNCFDETQIHIELFDDFQVDSLEVTKNIYNFLNVSTRFIPDIEERLNVSGLPSNQWLHFILNKPNSLKMIIKPLLPHALRRAILKSVNSKNITKQTIDPKTAIQLREIYRDDILKLQALIGRNLEAWHS